MGFCLLNNAAIAARARYLQAKYRLSKVAIIDWDVHHGNGTQSIFWEDPSVFYFSIHENPAFLYPGTGRRWETGKGAGEGTTLNVPMAPGSEDEEYRLAFEQMLAPAMERFRPEMIILSAGFDAHRNDPMADIQLTEEGFRFMSRFTVELANQFCGGKIVSLLEGGYERESLTRCTEIHIRELQKD
jgi:acetoin utilization deacetylase AcuC-like enzyme